MNATNRARELARHEPFAFTWRLLVMALHDLGERYLELRGDEVEAFITSVLPDAVSRGGPPRPEAAAVAGVRGLGPAAKVASAAAREGRRRPAALIERPRRSPT
jgi:hypothetical protein